MRNTIKIFFTISFALFSFCAFAQNDLIQSQYIHNRFAVNPAFAGNREGVTIFGGFRKQWAGIEKTPTSMLLTTHAPLRHDNIVVGLTFYNQFIHETSNMGALATIGYRTRATEKTWLEFALQPGVAMHSYNWNKIKLMDADDKAFSKAESATTPLLGFGMSWYGRSHFVGVSTTSLLVSNDFYDHDSKFKPDSANYIFTGGYMFDITNTFKLQPSTLVSFRKGNDTVIDGTLTAIYNDFIWVDAGYRTTDEITLGLAVQVKPQLRISYNYDMSIGDLNGQHYGSHEISIQYDFVYRVKTVSPKFF